MTQKARKKREGTIETGRNYKATESTKKQEELRKHDWKKVEQQDLMVFKNPKNKICKV